MKKRKIIGSALLSFMMVISMSATAAFGERTNGQESYRVLIQGPASEKARVKANFGVRWDFASQGFSTTVNAKQYQALLNNKNLTIERLPELQFISNTELAAKPGGTAGSIPSDQTPWGIQAMYNDATVAKTSGGSGIKVAVLDTGVNVNHADLTRNIEQCKDFSQNKTSLVEGSCADGNGHGTHVSGTVLANGGSNGQGIYGVAPDAKLWSYKVLNNRGSGYSDDIAAAIRRVADEAKSTGAHVIISMSLGSSTKDSLISSAVDYAYGKGVLVVAAAGNDGPTSNSIGYPGALVNVVAVAALENVQENGTYRVADFSSRGNPNSDGDYVIQERDVEVSAPGRAIESTWNDGSYNTISGTSMATPHVSGLAAKIWAASPSMSNVQLRIELQNRAKVYDIKGGTGSAAGDDYTSGFGFPRIK
ncbi:S8 family serine peptidase [Bacillus sp. ISL-40]|uniref:S8 family peptidase n=1 Tax=unclassified Bacillus (in: firmicutes) TaxID=185979 RepID=UPI001BE536C3|nr:MULTISPECIES: S8 family serine peptidase [unclassified Bacillus (in: firmicutes)]MBT2699491.1 S8 family serine peptidase [Bacillus sp. ISL-40]MBT2722022.1 S8 family serine peptidase [Bacillus sp. ISL-46]MBT2741630.1 S8 family serine peptidase [Bacillus sp. ISL-77]